ncbi:SAM-dependent methyltransferase [Prauserella marina]|uniref:dTDP-3-amino-3,6-dideoxy-alpha-D-glucopyranose N,N-dimethyltransferase/dTDP-3-amino-3,4,6-trideoxy-alpha-D-glucopyranose N,N-dimethyltransferase n=1 Tax=Prauserella marina TaxID=530584 RepID=A0A222VM84_9PSEU|nr:class I SAM-dependent methyltransferase [Prauserella marina]ASR34873.1 SAM-dependent methyltransferase [Prauserella marina]PWV85428.1 dTDP-3-amino-3,6-dideoxy-alpha-D-glucopyranose N,N-dimethyltransferase/dTDP-3-amino-3,4,6-trideoxy-alpha-D-glucopyranose N,N-dimethyltransferase [Prauserella marina]SDC55044.1 dTDP-3-amino-3,6-dideoxy-alpha-D-glucopyranose N,N-dimethyltransferase/dTDP-3-amino-3,4,6-trideoxy-alpha-D-glucopyranose N,N-dimethyltransferase [Prauserella marina]
MYGADLAEVFELIHRGRGKDYLAEAEVVTKWIRSRVPNAVSLLDVACGTGSHLKAFATLFDHVEGLEISEPFVRTARETVPGAELHLGDMRDFDLGRRFDAISCMFGSIGYLTTTRELTATLTRFAHHLVPGGAVAVDPWWFLENYADGYVSGSVLQVDGMTISRVSHSKLEGNASRMDVHYVVADSVNGARHFVENHLITLFTREQYETAFAAAGFAVDYIEGLHSGRGLFIGARK